MVNLYSPNVSVNLYSFMPPTINQSEHGYSVRHRAYVRCFNQSERGYGVRHGAYVTGCTYAFRPISARHSRILISAAPCGGLRNLAQPHATSRSLTQPHAASKKGVENLLLYYSQGLQFVLVQMIIRTEQSTIVNVQLFQTNLFQYKGGLCTSHATWYGSQI